MTNLITEMVQAKSEFRPSEEQNEVLRFFQYGEGHLCVFARAGTGKSTTLVAGIKLWLKKAARNARALYTAFNKDIILDAREKLGVLPGVECETSHAIGNRHLRRSYPQAGRPGAHKNLTRIESGINAYIKKTSPINLSEGDEVQEGEVTTVTSWLLHVSTKFKINELVSWVKDTNPFFKTVEAFLECSDQFLSDSIPKDLDQEECLTVASQIAYKSCVVLLQETKTGRFDYDFTDMIWLCIRLGIIRAEYDLVVIDEAQDLNVAQLELLRQLCLPDGQIFGVGDDRQAIYAFRGADSKALTRLSTELTATQLKLLYTFRCPQGIVAEANNFVEDFYAHPTAPLGEVHKGISRTRLFELAAPNDFILCRNNAPLVKICLKLLAQGKKAYMSGRKIGEGLSNTLKKVEGKQKYKNMPEMLGRLEEWATRERELIECSKKSPKEKLRLTDNLDDSMAIFDTFAHAFEFPEEIYAELKTLFADKKSSDRDYKEFTVCSSIHKSKGLERDNVFILLDNWGGRARTEEDGEQEKNLCYVAITRARKRLYYVNVDQQKDEE